MKKIIKTVFHRWYLYIIAIVVSSFVCSYYINFINMPRNEETISFFISSYTGDTNKINSYLKSKSPSYLREINITNVKPTASDFSYFFFYKGLNNADVFILHESFLTDEIITNQFATLDATYLSKFFVYTPDKTNHGILIHEKDGKDHGLLTFKSSQENDENFYIFYRINSLHIGKMNNSSFTTAFTLTKALLEYE